MNNNASCSYRRRDSIDLHLSLKSVIEPKVVAWC